MNRNSYRVRTSHHKTLDKVGFTLAPAATPVTTPMPAAMTVPAPMEAMTATVKAVPAAVKFVPAAMDAREVEVYPGADITVRVRAIRRIIIAVAVIIDRIGHASRQHERNCH